MSSEGSILKLLLDCIDPKAAFNYYQTPLLSLLDCIGAWAAFKHYQPSINVKLLKTGHLWIENKKKDESTPILFNLTKPIKLIKPKPMN